MPTALNTAPLHTRSTITRPGISFVLSRRIWIRAQIRPPNQNALKVIHAHTSICSMTTPWAIPGILSPSLKAYLGKKGACGHKKNPLPFPGYNLSEGYRRQGLRQNSHSRFLLREYPEMDCHRSGFRSLYEWVRAGCSVRTEDPGEFFARCSPDPR